MTSRFLMNLQLQLLSRYIFRDEKIKWMNVIEGDAVKDTTAKDTDSVLSWNHINLTPSAPHLTPGLMKPKAESLFVLWQKELYFKWQRKEYLSCLEQHLVYQVGAAGNRLKAVFT